MDEQSQQHKKCEPTRIGQPLCWSERILDRFHAAEDDPQFAGLMCECCR